MEASGGVDDHDVAVAGLRSRQRIEGHRGRIGAFLAGHHLDADALGPCPQLSVGRGSKRVRSAQDRRLAVTLQPMSEFGDGRRLASAVDTNDEENRRRIGDVQVAGPSGERLVDLRLERSPRLVHRAGVGIPHPTDDPGRRLDADIRCDESLFERFPELPVQFGTTEHRPECATDGLSALREPRAEVDLPAAGLGDLSGDRRGPRSRAQADDEPDDHDHEQTDDDVDQWIHEPRTIAR